MVYLEPQEAPERVTRILRIPWDLRHEVELTIGLIRAIDSVTYHGVEMSPAEIIAALMQRAETLENSLCNAGAEESELS